MSDALSVHRKNLRRPLPVENGNRPKRTRSYECQSEAETPRVSPSPRIWRAAIVEATVGLGRERIRQLEGAGQFPRRFKIAGTYNGWSADEIEQWVRDRINGPRVFVGTKAPLRAKRGSKGAAA